jgi:hypothetical protein
MPGRQPVRVSVASRLRRALVLFAGLAISSLAHAAAGPIFPNPGYSVGAAPIALASGDFNHDGIRDIVVVNRDSEDLSVLIGLGGGAFHPEQRYAMPDIPVDVVTAELDADGADDLVVALPRLDGVGVMRSDGIGHFGPVTLVPTGDSPSALATGDFDADGRADLAVAHFFGETSVFLGDGHGAFGAPHAYPAGIYPSDIAVADLDRDGRLDILVANAGSIDISVYMGTGVGNFLALPPQPTGPSYSLFKPVQVVTHDFDEDGTPDLLIVEFNNTDEINVVETLQGRGDGTFGPGRFNTQLADGQVGVGIGDFDVDGHDDLALTFGFGAICCFHNSGDIYRGLGHGAFDHAGSFQTGITPTALLQDDFDLDGGDDLAALSYQPALVTVLLGHRTTVPGVRGPEFVVPFSAFARDIVTEDLDGDGNPDLLPVTESASDLSVFYGLGSGAFAPRASFHTAGAPAGVLVADVDGDGRRDLVVAIDAPVPGLYWHRGLGGRAFAPAVLIASMVGVLEVRALDLDHDSLPDLAAMTWDEQVEIRLLRNLGGGAFAAPVPLPLNESPRRFTVGDLDGDGFSDLVIVTASDRAVLVLRGLGDGQFSSPTPLAGTAASVQLVDMNGDGELDLVGNDDQSIVMWPATAHGAFGLPVVLGEVGFIQAMVVRDFNGDGTQDVAFSPEGEARGDLGMLLSRANGTFDPASYFLPQAPGFDFFSSTFGSADFNHDGRVDLVLAYPTGSSDLALSVLLNQAPFTNHAPQAAATASSSAECTSPAGAAVLLDGSASSDPDSTPGTADDIAAYEWFEDFALPARRLVGQGALLQTTLALGDHAITLRVTDLAGATSTAELVVRVVDTAAPEAALRLTPDRLWPANHRLVDVQAILTASDACGETHAVLFSVTSSEPDGSGDADDPVAPGDISGATIGAADFAFRLRAERFGGGMGRVYTVRYLVTDASGNSALAAATVTVPHDLGGSPDPTSQRGGRRGAPGPKTPRPRS